MDYRIGFDIGGTFTDFFIIDNATGEMKQEKVPTQTGNLAQGIENGLSKIFESHDIAPSDIEYLAHGTTIATNAMLEQDGAQTGLVTTDGFRDILAIGREKRPNIYDFSPEKTPTFTERKHRFEVTERLTADGSVLEPLDEESVDAVIDELQTSDVESVAVSLLHSYSNDVHEQELKEAIEAETDLLVSLSSEVMPEIKEYERTLSTVINAYVGPAVTEYVANVQEMLGEIGITVPLHIMQANGGVITPQNIDGRNLQLINSGPAAGVLGAKQYGAESGIDNIITLDMGGTSADTCVIKDGEIETSTEGEINEMPLLFPQIDVRTVGAGGGSIAWLDRADVVKVGPKSSGAYPGPACYGRGGTEPTVTDAALTLGYLEPDYFLGGEMSLDTDAARDALESIGDQVGLDAVELSNGILDIVTTNMTQAIRLVTVEKGYDPREFALTLYGGAGPMFATRLARDLNIGRAFIPTAPGVLSASGLLAADKQFDFSKSVPLTLDPDSGDDIDVERVRDIYADLEDQGAAVAATDSRTIRTADIRYRGQTATLNIELPSELTQEALVETCTEFNDLYEQIYGHANTDDPLEVVTWRLRVIEETPTIKQTDDATAGSTDDAIKGTRQGYTGDEFREFTVYDRYNIPFGSTFEGPAIIEETESTTIAGPGSTVTVDDVGNILIELDV